MAGNRSLANVKFHTNATVPETGLEYTITSDASTLTIDFVDRGTNSTFEAIVEGKIDYESDWDSIKVYDTKLSIGTLTPNTLNTYTCDITGWSYIRVRLTSVNGVISTYGKLVG